MLCLKLQQQLDRFSCIDFDGKGSCGTEALFAPSGGKMFGILVCIDGSGHEVVLKAFSGEFQDLRSVPGWVSPACDADGGLPEPLSGEHVRSFHCIDGSVRSLSEIFGDRQVPPEAGDCCAPKLLDEAFKRKLLPVSYDQFFYGSSDSRRHKEFLPPCEQWCRPLIAAMLMLDILYVDSSIVVVNKEPGLLSVPGRGEEKQDCVVSRVKRLFPLCIEQPSVHRLDRDTSGLLVLAFTQEAHRELSIQFIKRTVSKRYVALLEGKVEGEGGTVELAFRYDPEMKPRQKYDPVLGKWGTTMWKRLCVQSYGGQRRTVTRVSFTPLTGRTHQLRLHSAHEKGLGHPIVGDPLYGTGEPAPRLMLHASELSFTHPVTRERMTFALEPDF